MSVIKSRLEFVFRFFLNKNSPFLFRYLVFCSVISFISPRTMAESPQPISLTLPQALEMSLKISPKIQKSESVVRETSYKKTEAFSTYYPTLSLGANYLFDKKYIYTDVQLGPSVSSVPAVVPTSSYSLTLQYSVFDGFASTSKYQSADHLNQSAVHESHWAQFQLQHDVGLLFYKALAAQTLKDVALANLKTLEDHLKDIQLFKKEGLSTKYDVLRVEVQVSEAKSELLNATDNIESNKGRLSEMIGLEDTEFLLQGKLPLPQEFKNQIDIINSNEKNNIFTQRADLKSLDEKIKSLDFQQKANSKHWSPKINLYSTWQSYNNKTNQWQDSASYRDAYQVGVNLTWNLFDGFASSAKDHQSIEQKHQAETQLRTLKLKSKQDFEFWKRKLNYYIINYEARLNDIQKSLESVRLAKEGVKVGSRTNTDLLDAEAEVYKAQAGAVNAQMGFIESYYNLELTLGKNISGL